MTVFKLICDFFCGWILRSIIIWSLVFCSDNPFKGDTNHHLCDCGNNIRLNVHQSVHTNANLL